MKKRSMDKYQFAKKLQEQKVKYYRIAYSYVKNEHDALDIVGEATYKALKDLHTLQQPEYFDTWMTRIVIYTAIDYIRKNARIVCYEDNLIDVMSVAESDLAVEDSMDLFDALDVLSERERAGVVLRYFEEYSFTKIAEILQEPEPTVKSRIYRALEKIHRFIEEGRI